MCGLVGWLAPPASDPDVLDAAVARMAATLVHRGPDDAGRWTDAEGGIALGFRRLAVLDVSAAGRQPMLSGDGRYACVFNGEIYNHRDLRAELERRGARFRGGSDTEVVVEAVAAFGPRAAVGRLWGMFALAVWDRVERTLLLARDRLGKKPLHVARLGEQGWIFASELKAFHAVERFRREIDPAALATYLRFGYVPAPRTIFRDAWKLEPGTCSLLRFGQPARSQPYWSARAAAREGTRARLVGSPAPMVAELDRLLRDAVARRLIADVPVGALLSGGIDSSVVVALMQAQSARPVKTFTVGFEERGYDESAPAAAVARHLGTDHTELTVSAGTARAVVPELADIYDEPFADSSQIPTLLIARLARQDVTVALSGDGGDEVFAGYRHYRTVAALSAAISAVPRPLRRPAGAFLTRVPLDWWDTAARLATAARCRGEGRRRFGERVHHAGPPPLGGTRAGRALLAHGVAVAQSRRAGAGWRPGARCVGVVGSRGGDSGFPRPHDALRPGDLSSRRHPGEGGPRQHGGQSGGPLALAGPSRCRVGVAPAVRHEAPPGRYEVDPAAGAAPLRSAPARRSAEDGFLHTA